MPEGPIFGDQRVGSPVQVCRAPPPKKAPGWDLPCLLNILCKKDSDVIDHVRKNVNLYKVDRVYFEDNYFDGKSWVIKTFEAGGTNGGGDITFLAGDNCVSAATTLYHETWHSKQPAGMGWPHTSEDDAYYNTELWTIERGLPGQQGNDLRMKNAKGKWAPDKKAIEKFVDQEYPTPPPSAPPEWQITDIDKKGSQTRWRNRKTGKQEWKASAKGDTLAGPEITKGKTLVPSASIKCP